VDDRRQTFPHQEPSDPIGSDAAPIAENVQRESALVVCCGTDQQVSEGFAIALRRRRRLSSRIGSTFFQLCIREFSI
jgi:hypothetical protein